MNWLIAGVGICILLFIGLYKFLDWKEKKTEAQRYEEEDVETNEYDDNY
jgi:hypothetical protein